LFHKNRKLLAKRRFLHPVLLNQLLPIQFQSLPADNYRFKWISAANALSDGGEPFARFIPARKVAFMGNHLAVPGCPVRRQLHIKHAGGVASSPSSVPHQNN
jgi:hypothetical protein